MEYILYEFIPNTNNYLSLKCLFLSAFSNISKSLGYYQLREFQPNYPFINSDELFAIFNKSISNFYPHTTHVGFDTHNSLAYKPDNFSMFKFNNTEKLSYVADLDFYKTKSKDYRAAQHTIIRYNLRCRSFVRKEFYSIFQRNYYMGYKFN